MGYPAGRPGHRTKIVCTLGPASQTPAVLAEMIRAGMDVARFNLSHGDHADHERRLAALRAAQAEAGREVAVLFDLRGPEVRLMLPDDGGIEVGPGDRLALPATTWPGLAAALRPGARVLLADGAVVAEVAAPDQPGEEPGRPVLVFRSGGTLRQRSKVVLPGLKPDLPPLSPADLADIKFGVAAGADLFAMSFVHDARDVLLLRDELRRHDHDAAVIAKIETRAGYDNLQAILAVCDGAMVARGDLGVECSFEEVPRMQKEILALCGRLGKPGITATEMLESMTRQPRPTRAEASDVFNAVLDGTDAVMLSAETAIGEYPAAAVEAMRRIAGQAERVWAAGAGGRRPGATQTSHPAGEEGPDGGPTASPPVAIAGAAVWAADAVGASAIITPTRSGYTARMVSRLRPRAPIIAVSSERRTAQVLRLSWGVIPLRNPAEPDDDPVETSLVAAARAGLIGGGDLVAITAGVPSGVPGTTNMLQLRTIGEILARGSGLVSAAAAEAGGSVVSGPLCVVADPAAIAERFQPGCVLAVEQTDASMVPYLAEAAAVLTVEGGLSSHAAIVCLSLGKPVVVGVRRALDLPHGQVVTVDAGRGVIYQGQVRPV